MGNVISRQKFIEQLPINKDLLSPKDDTWKGYMFSMRILVFSSELP